MTAPATRPDGPPPLSTTAVVTTFGTLAWVGLVWVGAAAVVAVTLVGFGIWGQLGESLWHGLGAGLQRWLFVIVGYTMVTEFGRMFLTNGITRAQLARSVVVTALVVSVLGAVVAALGYLAEGVVFDLHDWRHGVETTGELIHGPADHLRLFGESLLTLPAFFTTGWLIGICYRSRPRDEANLLVVPCLLPAAAAQLLVRGDTAVFGFLDRLDVGAGAWLGAAVTAVVVVAGMAVAARATRQIVV